MKTLDEFFAARPSPEVNAEEEDELVREAFLSARADYRPAR